MPYFILALSNNLVCGAKKKKRPNIHEINTLDDVFKGNFLKMAEFNKMGQVVLTHEMFHVDIMC